jgi:alkanesulfonate monooxygenase SsuD/methylene tetrahydromethanopterin reductase-like flavin-dependent oxidoreductase (luciferase family)
MNGLPINIELNVFAVESSYLNARPWAYHYRHDLQRHLALAEELDYDTVWLAEHHHSYSGYIPSDLAAAGACVANTEKISIGTGVLLLPLHSAQRIAEGCAVIDELAPGRLRLGMGMGYAMREFAAGGVDPKRRGRIMEARLEELTGEYADRLGGTELWVGAHADVAIRRAARFGCSMYFLQIGDVGWLQHAREVWEADLNPREGQVPRITVGNGIWASRDKKELDRARRRFSEMFVHYSAYMAQGIYMDYDEKTGRILQRSREDEPWHDPTDTATFGTPEEIVERLAPLITEGGADGLIFYVENPGTDGAELEEQLHVLAEEVVPHLRSLR